MSLTIHWVILYQSALTSPLFLFPSLPRSVLSTFSSEFHGSVHQNCVKSKWLTKRSPFLFSLQMRWVGKWDKRQGHDELNIDAPWANRKGRVPDTCLEISFIIHDDHVKDIPCQSLGKFSFAQCTGTNWPCIHAQHVLQQSRVAEPYMWLSPTHQYFRLLHALRIPQRWGAYQILYLKWESWKSWSFSAHNDRLVNWECAFRNRSRTNKAANFDNEQIRSNPETVSFAYRFVWVLC